MEGHSSWWAQPHLTLTSRATCSPCLTSPHLQLKILHLFFHFQTSTFAPTTFFFPLPLHNIAPGLSSSLPTILSHSFFIAPSFRSTITSLSFNFYLSPHSLPTFHILVLFFLSSFFSKPISSFSSNFQHSPSSMHA